MFWAEHDVFPIRDRFIDRLLHEITFSDEFFIKGSIHRGTRLDSTPKTAKNSNWIAHINGNALYNMRSKEFTAMVRQAKKQYNPNVGFMHSMDIAIWRVAVGNFLYNWKIYQQYAHKFVYSDYIQSYCTLLSETEVEAIREQSPNTYLLHGNTGSAGNQFFSNRLFVKSNKNL